MEKLYQLSARYNTIWTETNQLYEDWAHRHGMSLYELLVILSIVETEGGVLQKDICRKYAIPKQTVSAIIKALTDKAWLEPRVSHKDRRSRELHLTERGKEQTDRIARELQDHEAKVWFQLGLDRAEQLIEYTSLYNRFFREVSD